MAADGSQARLRIRRLGVRVPSGAPQPLVECDEHGHPGRLKCGVRRTQWAKSGNSGISVTSGSPSEYLRETVSDRTMGSVSPSAPIQGTTMPSSALSARRSFAAILSASGAACLTLGALAVGGAPAVTAAGTTTHSQAADQHAIDGVFSKEPAPQLDARDAVALAGAPAGADPVAFDRKALATAKAASHAAK